MCVPVVIRGGRGVAAGCSAAAPDTTTEKSTLASRGCGPQRRALGELLGLDRRGCGQEAGEPVDDGTDEEPERDACVVAVDGPLPFGRHVERERLDLLHPERAGGLRDARQELVHLADE